jgi:hypothetical protein
LGQSTKHYRTFYSKNCHSSLKIIGLGSGIWDPISGKTYSGSRIPDPGVKKAPDPGSASASLVGSKFFLRNGRII